MPNLARHIDAVPRRPHGVTDKPIDSSIPYRPRERGASRHFGFFPFFTKKPWGVVQEYINHYTSPGDLVCDPFAGTGVTAVESLVLHRRAVTTDINPVARFITRMTAVAPVNIDDLNAAFEQVRADAQAVIESLDSMPESEIHNLLARLDYPRVPIPAPVRRGGADSVNQLHTPRQLAALTILRDAINKTPDVLMGDLLRVALANTVRYANRTYAGRAKGSQYRGNANFLRRFSYSLASEDLFYEHLVWPTFERTFKGVVKTKQETNQLIGEWYNPTNFTLSEVPASRIHEVTGEGVVDYCFTDPPYSNDINYLDLSVLWAAWLGFEISDEARRNELLEGGVENKSRQQFEQEFAAAMESIARALKEDRWFTLVYKHRDLSLWQSIVAACEASGLQYVNSVWQDVKIASTRQIECPNINPKGDMYLNFRKMPRQKFESIYPTAEVVDLPTRPNYLAKEVERLVVSYLGADITLITSGVIQQILDSRAFRNYRDNPASLEQDIRKIVQPPHFTTWQLGDEAFWVLTPQTSADPSLPAIDRARYYVFDFLREKKEATEGEVSRHLLTRFANEPNTEVITEGVPALLHQVARVIGHRRWQFDANRVARYKQLRLFFQRASVDQLREKIENKETASGEPLRPNFEGLAFLYDRLHGANTDNRQFETQWGRLLKILKVVLQRLTDNFEDQIERVLAIGEWAQHGIDLRNTPFEDVMLEIVLRSEERPFALYQEISDKAFSNLNDDDILVQFHLLTKTEWEHAKVVAQLRKQEGAPGISVLDRT